jgi:excisionase family DNA binding protein
MRTDQNSGNPGKTEPNDEELFTEAAQSMKVGRPLTKRHLAAWASVTERYIELEMNRGHLRAVKNGRFVRFRPADVERWLEQFLINSDSAACA